MSDPVPVLTIDGPSGAGKGTVSRIVASRLGWHYLDSGALYRAVGVAASWADLDVSDPAALVRCAFDTRVGFRETEAGLRVIVVTVVVGGIVRNAAHARLLIGRRVRWLTCVTSVLP